MRARPKLKVYLSPSPVRPGDTLTVTAVLTATRETPVKGIDFQLVCDERTTIPHGQHSSSYQRQHFALAARHGAMVLAPGEHRYHATFVVPPNAPWSYESDRSRVASELTVKVGIPWWLDAKGRYVVEVVPPVRAGTAPRPGLFATTREGPLGRELYAECSLDSVLLEPGGVVQGRVSLSNVAGARVERVTAALAMSETQRVDGYTYDWVLGRYEFVLHEGAVADGEAIPFGLALPRNLPLTQRTAFLDLKWTLEIRAEGPWRTRDLLAIPVTLVPAGTLPSGSMRAMAPAVGRARRQQVWAPAAQNTGLVYEPERDAVAGSVGDVSLTIAVEQRVRDGLFTVATLRWPAPGIALSVGPARWNDRLLRREIDVGDRAFDARFRVRGRFADQVRAVLSPAVRARLMPMADVRPEDDRAVLSVPGALSDPSAVVRFFADLRALAADLDAAVASVPVAPPAIEAADAWRAWARGHQARFRPGPCAIDGARLGVDRVDLSWTWSDEGAPTGTALVMHLDPPLANAPDPAALDEAAAPLRALRRDATVLADAHTITVTVPTREADPAALTAVLDALLRAGRKLLNRGDAAPYR